MLKKVREEKTFKNHAKPDIKEALSGINKQAEEERKAELEDMWLAELLERKKQECVKNEESDTGKAPMIQTSDSAPSRKYF